jgi:hypothetical protein
MRTQKEIQGLARYLAGDFYGKRINEQKVDQTYYDDTFKVPWIDDPLVERRTGKGARLVDSPAERIVTSNPVAYRDYSLKKDKESAEKIAKLFNEWIRVLKRQQFFKGHIKTNIKRGEAWIQVCHNYDWIKNKKGLPVHFILPEPMIVLASPKEDEEGVPEFVIMKYERAPLLLAQIYPQWSKGKKLLEGEGDLKKQSKFLYYIDPEQEYAEIDGEVVRDQKNIYGFTPFIHKYSGFGSYSPNALPEERAVGRLRFSRHTLERYTSLISDMDSAIHLFSNRSITFKIVDEKLTPDEVAKVVDKHYKVGAGYRHIIPAGVEDKRSEEMLPDQPVFQYLGSVLSDLEREDPLAMSELPLGSSGRQDDIVESWSLRRYDSIVENTEQSCNTAFGKALKVCEKVPGLMPEGISKEDIGDNYQCRIELKAADPLEKSARITLGGRMKAQDLLSLEKFHIDYCGMSQEESKQERANIICDKIEASAPVEDLYAMVFAEEANLEEYLDKLVAGRREQGKTPTEQRRIQGETQTERGMGEMAYNLEPRGARRGPEISR